MKKQYLGISRDHSGSMRSLRNAALKDYNDTIQATKGAASANNIDTIVSVVSQGISSSVRREVVNSNLSALVPLRYYEVDGGTPLFDSVGELIEIFKQAPDYNNPDVTFLVIAITDGEENRSIHWKTRLGAEIKRLQATDRWTFVFRVPQGYAANLVHLGVPSGNIQEWETTERGLQDSSTQTISAISNYYSGVSRGITSSQCFYANMDKVGQNQVQAVMINISPEVEILTISRRSSIESFFSLNTNKPYRKGTAFYQLSKTEKIVQDYKVIAVRNRITGAVYAGAAARQILVLPTVGNITLKPGDHGNWDIYIQSTSSNRILLPGTTALYWPNA